MNEIFKSTGINEENDPSFTLNGNYPNPFSSSTSIHYILNNSSEVDLSIYSISGEKLITLVNERQAQGQKSIEWNALNSNGQKVSSGIYLYKLKVGKQVETGKIVLADEVH